MANLKDFMAGWDCWVLWDRDFPAKPTRSFNAGYEAARHENDQGGGERPQLVASDDTWESYWQKHANHVVEQPAPFRSSPTVGRCAVSYSVYDYQTGEALAGDPTAELVSESLSREPTGAVGAYLAGGEWRWLDDGDPEPCGSVDCRTVYVLESLRG